MPTTETWQVRHDAYPEPVVFTYTDEAEAREAFKRDGFYDPGTGWGVTLIHRSVTTEKLATTKPTPSRSTSAGPRSAPSSASPA